MSKADDFDYEKLLSLLPRHKILKPVDLSKAKLPIWRWPPLKSYNGFTSDERIRTWQIGTYLLNIGAIKKPDQCDICKKVGPVGFHSENYYDIRMDPFLCKSCHTILHNRFKYPDQWNYLVNQNIEKVETWFSILIPTKVNLAKYIRLKFTKLEKSDRYFTANIQQNSWLVQLESEPINYLITQF
ncbi:MAG: hypothetical protein H6912_03205 [Kordiimonadaceae bacterium]|nr:hypothetical protein [Kordiimonadaceae bacterium]